MQRNPEKNPSIFSFRPEDRGLITEGHRLAKDYGMSLNKVLTYLLENAIQEWAVPGMEIRARPEEQDGERQLEKDLT